MKSSVVNANNKNENLPKLTPDQTQFVGILETFVNENFSMSIVVTAGVAVFTICVVLFFGIWKYKSKVLPSQSEASTERKYRFRKRDKVIFMGRKLLRKVHSFTSRTMGVRRRSAQRLVPSRFRRFLQMRDSSLPQLKKKVPPSKFLEADWSDFEESDPILPPEIFYMLRSVRVFGHLEKPFFLELCKFMESVKVRGGDYLFNVGDQDNCIYVVQSGVVEVFINEKDGEEHIVKVVHTGDSIHSLLSIMDVLTGHPAPYKTVSAKAVVDSTIIKLPATAFNSMFERFNESVVRMVQIIMIRLQRVTFMALHNYLGLTNELINSVPQQDLQSLHIHALSRGPVPSSPQKKTLTPVPFNVSSEVDGSCSSTGTKTTLKTSAEEESEKLQKMSDFETAVMRAGLSDDEAALRKKSVTILEDGSWSGSRRLKRGSSEAEGSLSGISDEFIIHLAKKDLVNIMGLKDPTLLDGRVELTDVKAGTYLCKQGDQDASLVFVVRGTMHVLQQTVGSTKEVKLFSVTPGEMIGVLAVLTGEPSFFTIKAKSDVTIISISKANFYSIMREEPFIVLNTGHLTIRRMSAFVRQIDFALDWQMTQAGKALFRQGDNSDYVYIVLTGRLRSVMTLLDGTKEVIGEYGRGELVGIVEVLAQTERATTIMAIRDTEVAKIPEELLTLIKLKYPQVVTQLIHLLGQRLLGNLQNRNSVALSNSISRSRTNVSDTVVDNQAMVANLATVAVVPASESVPLEYFTLELQHALNAIGPTTRLTSAIIKQRLGAAALDSVNEFRLSSWLNQQEDIHRMVLYQCDTTITKWTKHCLRQADAILILVVADSGPAVGKNEKDIETIDVRAQKELILLHKCDADTPQGTAEWLNARGWRSSFHHIQCNKRVFSRKPPEKMRQVYARLFETEPDRMTDISRLARFLTGTSIGLVLGGGGARGLAHVGMIKALQEAGIPIDMVGGTSMGSFIGALWAEEREFPNFNIRAKEWSISMTSIWKKLMDFTYPYTSMFTGGAFNEVIQATFPNRQIEDLWIPYFCITTDITNSTMRVHTTGSAWRYVRASMSLSGYLPPLCDPEDGHLLLDGGYVNNLPADVMRSMGARTIFAIDVGSQDDSNLTNYGDQLSGWWVLWKRWNPWSSSLRVPDMTEIQSRLAYVSCVRQLEIVKNSEWCEYIRPPIDKYGTLQFKNYDEIMEVGYNHGKTLFSGWAKGGLVKKLFTEKVKTKPAQAARLQTTCNTPSMANFTDLAELVSRIEKPQSQFYLDTESDISQTEDDNRLQLDPEDDEYLYDDDIIEEEDDDSEDEEGDERYREDNKVYQTHSEPCVSSAVSINDDLEQDNLPNVGGESLGALSLGPSVAGSPEPSKTPTPTGCSKESSEIKFTSKPPPTSNVVSAPTPVVATPKKVKKAKDANDIGSSTDQRESSGDIGSSTDQKEHAV